MDNKQKQKKKFFASRKFKYGSAATVLTAFFIAAVILMNVIVSAIDNKFNLYFDLTEDQLFSIGEASSELVDQQFESYRSSFGEEAQIKITFLVPRDVAVADEMKNWVVSLAESYAEKYSQITVEYKEDLLTHPENYAYITEKGDSLDVNTIIVSNAAEGTYRRITFDNCLIYTEDGSSVWAFAGEMKFNAAIIYLTSRKNPVVSFTTGHGETKPEALVDILTNCGFEIHDVDLTKDDISPDSKILFMCSPQKDLTYSEDDTVRTEYTKISDYLNSYRSMVVIGSPNMPKLPVLDELLEGWGLEIVRNQLIMDDLYSDTTGKQNIYLNYVESDAIAAAITNSLTKLSSPPRTLAPQSAPINILKTGDGEIEGVEAVLTSSDNSYVEIQTENGIEKKQGPFNVMAISTRFTYIDNNETYSHLLVIGSEYFTEYDAYREQSGNTDIVYNIIRLLSDEYVPMETNYKVLEDYDLSIDNGQVYTYGIITVAVIPIIIFAFGLVVYFKRKHM